MTATTITTAPTLANLSADSMRVLLALIEASAGNDYDFGFMDEARAITGFDHHKFAGHIAALQDFINWSDDLSADSSCNVSGVQFQLIRAFNNGQARGDVQTALKALSAPEAPEAPEAPAPTMDELLASHHRGEMKAAAIAMGLGERSEIRRMKRPALEAMLRAQPVSEVAAAFAA